MGGDPRTPGLLSVFKCRVACSQIRLWQIPQRTISDATASMQLNWMPPKIRNPKMAPPGRPGIPSFLLQLLKT